MPETAEEAVELADMGALAPTLTITVERREGERFDRVVAYRLGDKPLLGDGFCREATAQVNPERPCSGCGRHDRSLQPGSGPHAAKEVCAWCGRWLRWVSKDEYERRMLDEVPF